jgi:hypothetical protein
VLKEIEGKVPRADMVKVAQQASQFPKMASDRLESDCRRCLIAVAKAEGTVNSVRYYSRITSYALIVDEAIKTCPNCLRPPVAAAT